MRSPGPIPSQLSDLALSAPTLALLTKAGYLTAREILLIAPPHLARKLQVPLDKVSDIVLEVSFALEECAGNGGTVADLVSVDGESDSITTGDEGMDALFGGAGIRLGGITEVAGQSASGKSHFALQLALSVQLPVSAGGQRGGCIFISSEGIVPSERLLEIGARLLSERIDTNDDPITVEQMMDNIHLTKAPDVDSLLSLLNFFIPAKLSSLLSSPPTPPIKLIILDSIAAPFRVSHSSTSSGFITRSKEFSLVGTQLKSLAYTYNLAVLIINQVSDSFTSFSPTPPTPPFSPDAPHMKYALPAQLYSPIQTPHFSGQSRRFNSTAALGHTWAGIVNTRVMVYRTARRVHSQEEEEEGGRGMVVRRMEAVFSPCAERRGIDYLVKEGGIRSVGELWDLRVEREEGIEGDGLEGLGRA